MSASAGLERTPDQRSKVNILGLELDRLNMTEVMSKIDRFVQEDEPRQVVTVNLQFMSLARKNEAFQAIVNRADMVVADGMPLVWVSKMKGAPIASRVTGHDILQECAELASNKGYSIFLLGGAPGRAQESAQSLSERYPGLRVYGTHHGTFSDMGVAERQDELTRQIREFDPDILLVGLGCPKQEYWIHNYMDEVGVPVCVGVGGVFDVLTGRLHRAPGWMQRCGIEWIYRLKQEPGRLWKRYFLDDLPTTLLATAEAVLQRLSFGKQTVR